MTRKAKALLEPGALLGGALFRDWVERSNAHALPPGSRLGAFRVVRELGRGGMGVVHLGERDDGEFSQRVALKCAVDRGSAANSELFRRERQILAGLHHPNIARLLDGGSTDDGLLWFAMEWVDGERIDVHCRRHAPSLEQRLSLWIQVAEAVQFAHARLLIHCDIKPGNVLVDAEGRARLLDFGIASLLGDGGPRAYSPGHASPEQRAGGEVGTASDQYQLGRLLEAMLHVRGCDGEATTSLVAGDPLRTQPPVPPPDAGFAARGTRGDATEWMPMSAARRAELTSVIARARAENSFVRYGSVAELKAELQRMLDHRPVDARRGRWGYALACMLRRRPWTSAVAVVASIAVLVMVVAFNARIAHERDVALAETAKVTAINAFVSDDLLATANPFESSQPGISVREALDRARARVGTRFAANPAVESGLRRTLGMTYAGVGELSIAGEELEHALALRRAIEAPDMPESVEIRLQLIHRSMAASDYADAEKRTLVLVDELAAKRPGHDPQRIRADIALLEVLGFLGKSEAALALDRALKVQLDRADADPELGLEHADVRAHVLLALGRADEARTVFEAAAARSAQRHGVDDFRTLRLREGQARALRDAGRLDEAIVLLRELHAKRIAAFGAEHRESLRNHNELAVALSRHGERAEAIAIWSADLEIKQRALGPAHASTLSTRYNLGNELIASQRYADAEQTFRELLAAERAARGDSDPGALTTQMSLANAVNRQARPAEALVLLDGALEAGRETLAGRPELGILYGYRSRSLAALGRQADARSDAGEAIRVFESTVGAEHRRTVQARAWLQSLAEPSGDARPR